MEREVFVLIKNHQFDCGECGLDCIGVYDTFELAQKTCESQMEKSRDEMKEYVADTEEDDYSKGDMSWSIWEKGEYCYNHIDLLIQQAQIVNEEV